ncbi:MAG: purine-nucleoside phosphorylase [Longimicrobiales bacterium]
MSEAARYLRTHITISPRVFMVLGSGLGALADQLERATAIPFEDIPGFASATVAGHGGRLVGGELEGVPCLVLQGRYHIYEGLSAHDVAFPVRVAAELGAQILIVTNAAGGINRRFRAGDLMIIDDHINLQWRNPLIGPAQDEEPRFPDMSEPYDRELQASARRVASQRGLRVVEGTYVGILGPSYETPAEVRMYERLGADAVGMSTLPEVIAARARGLRVLGISLISNVAAGFADQPLSHEDVIEAGRAANEPFAALLRGVLNELR